MNGKPWWKSKTVWVNIFLAAAAILAQLEGWLQVTTLDVPAWVAEIAVLAAAVVNIGLRLVTREPIRGVEKPRTL